MHAMMRLGCKNGTAIAINQDGLSHKNLHTHLDLEGAHDLHDDAVIG